MTKRPTNRYSRLSLAAYSRGLVVRELGASAGFVRCGCGWTGCRAALAPDARCPRCLTGSRLAESTVRIYREVLA